MASINAAIIVGLTVGTGFVLLLSFLSSITYCSSSGVQLQAPDNERLVKFSDFIVYGTVINGKLQPYYAEDGRMDVRTVVTIKTDRFLLDKTGNHPVFITYFDLASGCASVFKSKPNDEPINVTYKQGQRALFFISAHEGDWLAIGYFNKFDIVEDGTKLQSKYMELENKAPVSISVFEQEIISLVEKYHKDRI